MAEIPNQALPLSSDASVQIHLGYRPLDSARQEIRLAEIQGLTYLERTRQVVPKLHIEHVSLQRNDLHYAALSYTWGQRQSSIVISDEESHSIESLREISVSKNLVDALHCLLDKGDFGRPSHEEAEAAGLRPFIWIDQVCIDQKNNIEKANQVRMMTQIYSRATCVFVWLEPGVEDRQLAIDTIAKLFEERYNLAHVVDEMRTSDLKYQRSDASGSLERSLKELCENNMEQLRAIETFCQNEWFHRAWVVQEVSVAKEKMIFDSSGQMISWRELLILGKLLHFFLLQAYDIGREPSTTLTNLLISACMGVATTVLGRYVDDGRRLMSFADLFQRLMLSDVRATLPQDFAFSLIGIAYDGATCGIEIDYNKPLRVALTQIALVLLREKGADVLAWRQSLEPFSSDLPSWIPDPRTGMNETLHMSYTREGSKPKLYSASGHKEFDFTVDEHFGMLHLRSTFVAVVAELEEIPAGLSILPAVRLAMDMVAKSPRKRQILEQYDTQRIRFLLMRLFFADRREHVSTGKRRAPQSDSEFQDDLCSEDGTTITLAYSTVYYMHRKAILITENGLVGIGPQAMVKGDEVHVVWGSDVPFILRKDESDEYHRVVGEAFIHGIMDGESLTSNPEPTWLKIH